ncbi:MAG: DUF6262 family protein [Blautia sp.]
MSKYDKMVEENQKKSKEKIAAARYAIREMLEDQERISVPKLMKRTGLSRGFFYKNSVIREEMNRALEQQAGMIDPRREILNMALEQQNELYRDRCKIKRENADLRKRLKSYKH